MSALVPKATQLMRRNDWARGAKSRQARRSKKGRFDHLVTVANSAPNSNRNAHERV